MKTDPSGQNRQINSLLINPRFQWTLIGYTALIAATILVSMYGLFSYGFHEFMQVGTQAGFPPTHPYFQFIQMQEASFLKVIAAIALVVSFILIVGGLFISHKIAGPLYRMRKDLLKMAEKNPAELKAIQFRKGDFFPDLPEAFNELVEAMRKNKGA